jgi:hypothetical protein
MLIPNPPRVAAINMLGWIDLVEWSISAGPLAVRAEAIAEDNRDGQVILFEFGARMGARVGLRTAFKGIYLRNTALDQ